MGHLKVRDVMTPGVITVGPSMPLHDVARAMAEHGISGAPVVDPAGELIGVISEGDFLLKERGRAARPKGALDRLFGRRADMADDRRLTAQTAGQAMSAPPVTIDDDRAVREAAALMIDRAINRLPVLSAGRLVGIVTRADLVRAYLRRDDETLRTIREEVLHDTMWIDPDDLQVEVTDGHVRLAGSVDRRSTATILEKLIGLVDGVDRVHNDLRWRFDDTKLAPPPGDSEPGAASLIARERPRSLHG
jgi:CBS domain-containing protein